MNKRVRLLWAALGRLLKNCGDKTVLATVITALAIGLMWLETRFNPPGPAVEPANSPDSGLSVRVEVIHLWLPQSLVDFARRQFAPPIAPAHQELQTPVEHRTQENLWYALTKRLYNSDGTWADVTYTRRPYREPWRFPEFLDVLAMVARDPPSESGSVYYGAELHILPSELSEREPREVLTELLNGSVTTSDRTNK
jgi:hypothetical protein